MPRFDDGVLREIHSRIDIGAFIGQYVSLKKRGADLVGLCPFHGEKTPSFHVHPDKGYFMCFGCGAGGDVITFVRKLENLDFNDAVRTLAAKAGIALESEDPRAARVRNEKEAIYQANAIAAAYFARMLKSDAGATARAYCERRGLHEATIEKFTLGYAPGGWNGLTDELRDHGVDLALAERAGLVKPSQRGGYYDFYRNRLMVPTYATTGEAIAFGGRELGSGEPKYLNTSTTPVYAKGEHLFALNIARRAAQASKTLIVVEGYLDCIALHQAGFENSVAALGTAFTEKQAVELRKYAENVFLCFDADSAGGNAATKAVDIASKVIEHAGSSVRVVSLPEGEDPDSFVRANGPAAFSSMLEAAKPSIDYKLDAEIERLRSGFVSRSVLAQKGESLVRDMVPRLEWDRYRQYVAHRLEVNVDDLRNSRFLSNPANFAPRSAGSSTAGTRHVPVHDRASRGAAPESLSFEREVLGIVLEDPTLAIEYGERIDPARFRSDVYRRAYERIVANARELRDEGDVFALFADDDDGLAALTSLGARDRSSIVRYGDAAERREHLDRIVERLALDGERERYAALDRSINETLGRGDSVSPELRSEFNALAAKLKLKK
jgi:DNA primase